MKIAFTSCISTHAFPVTQRVWSQIARSDPAVQKNVLAYIVPCLPPNFFGFWHAGEKRYINREGQLPAWAEDDARLDQTMARMAYTQRHARKLGHVGLRDLSNHSPINYVRALWTDA